MANNNGIVTPLSAVQLYRTLSEPTGEGPEVREVLSCGPGRKQASML